MEGVLDLKVCHKKLAKAEDGKAFEEHKIFTNEAKSLSVNFRGSPQSLYQKLWTREREKEIYKVA